jgi:UDP-N-acetylmuramoyl-L-alanine---L-glutamate ligase
VVRIWYQNDIWLCSMRASELRGIRVAIWGFAREGRAALQFLRERGIEPSVLDDSAVATDAPLIVGRDAIADAIGGFDVVVKSPGISLYDPLVRAAQGRGVRFTSLLNLWFAERPICRTFCVTGTKGKSTTTALITHVLTRVGIKAMAAGNIGVPITELPRDGLDAAVIEVSSYQAADFNGLCDVAVLTSLSQEHLDWHGGVEVYQRDKLNLLLHAKDCLISADALPSVSKLLELGRLRFKVFPGTPDRIVCNAYLARAHNRSNLAGALAVARMFGINADTALRAAVDFAPLPHRQQEIGEADNILFVDDSISTTPEAAIAALDVYRDRDVTVILGGHDRGIDYGSLVTRLQISRPNAVILMDASGKRIHSLLPDAHHVNSMLEAVTLAKKLTPRGGVILLSPAAPSYGTYRSFIERGQDFARRAGLEQPLRR